jgi:outer membrane protein assembly factor BamB
MLGSAMGADAAVRSGSDPAAGPGSDGPENAEEPDDLVAAYAAAPVTNPDGTTGIALHVFVDEALPHNDVISYFPAGPNSGPSFVNFYDVKAAHLERAHQAAFHYAVVGHTYNTVGGLASGASWAGTDMIWTIPVFDFTAQLSAPDPQVTMMHELGHNFGLQHGGDEETPAYKPNYLSVMNYRFSDGLPRLGSAGQFQLVLDYAAPLPTLHETGDLLDENIGISTPPTILTTHACPGSFWTQSPGNQVDWNCNGDPHDTAVTFDIDGDGITTDLHGFDDWTKVSSSMAFQCLAGYGKVGLGPSDPAFLNEEEGRDPIVQKVPVQVDIATVCTANAVALLPGATLDVAMLSDSTVDTTGVHEFNFQGATSTGTSVRDVNLDGRNDVVGTFSLADVNWTPNSIFGSASGVLSDGRVIFGSDRVTIGGGWPSFHASSTHDGRACSVGPPAGRLQWQFGSRGAIASSPAVGRDGSVYFGSSDHHLYAVRSDGSLKWRTRTGGGIASSPAVTPDGAVYVGSDDGFLYALAAEDGDVICKKDLGGREIESSPAIGGDGTVYVGSGNHKFYALDPKTCAVRWAVTTGGRVDSSAAVGADRSVYFGSDDNKVYARKPDGTAKWTVSTGGDVDSSPALSRDGSVVYVGSHDKFLWALRASNGSTVWKTSLAGEVRSSPGIGADGTVYVGSDSGKVYALNRTDGSVRWSKTIGSGFGRRVTVSPAVDAGGVVFVAPHDPHRVYALRGTDGAVVWTFDTRGDMASSPAIAVDGTLYIGSDDNFLYSLK